MYENTPAAPLADVASYEDDTAPASLDAGHTNALMDKFRSFEIEAGRTLVSSGDRAAREMAEGALNGGGNGGDGGVYENSPAVRRTDVVREQDSDATEAGLQLHTRRMKDVWTAKETGSSANDHATPAQVATTENTADNDDELDIDFDPADLPDLTDFDLTLTGEMRRAQNRSAADNRRRAELKWQAKRVEHQNDEEDGGDCNGGNGDNGVSGGCNGSQVSSASRTAVDTGRTVASAQVSKAPKVADKPSSPLKPVPADIAVNRRRTAAKWEEIRRGELSGKGCSSAQSGGIDPAADIAAMRRQAEEEQRLRNNGDGGGEEDTVVKTTPPVANQAPLGPAAIRKRPEIQWTKSVEQEVSSAPPPARQQAPAPNVSGARKSTEQRWREMRAAELDREAAEVSSIRICTEQIAQVRAHGLQPQAEPETPKVEAAATPAPVVEAEPYVDSFHERRRRRNLASRQPPGARIKKKAEQEPSKPVAPPATEPQLTPAQSIVKNRRTAEEKWMNLRQSEEEARRQEINQFRSYVAPPPAEEPEPEPVVVKPSRPQRNYGGGGGGFGNCYRSPGEKQRLEEEKKMAAAKEEEERQLRILEEQERAKKLIKYDSDGEPIVDKWSNISNLWGTTKKKKPAAKNQISVEKTAQQEQQQREADEKRFRFKDNWQKR